ncbi:MAG: ATP-dependent metallopeptidase FtsH/Yme1/Tma family protein, partial [Gaiellaceae bacterium]
MQPQSGGGQGWAAAIVASLFALFLFGQLAAIPLWLTNGPRPIPYSQFLDLVRAGMVRRVTISTQEVDGVYRAGRRSVSFVAVRPPGV